MPVAGVLVSAFVSDTDSAICAQSPSAHEYILYDEQLGQEADQADHCDLHHTNKASLFIV